MTDISWSMQLYSFGLHHMATKGLDTKKSFNREISLATYIHTYIHLRVYLGTACTNKKVFADEMVSSNSNIK